MTCASCVGKIERVIGRLVGVRAIRVGLLAEQAEVELFDNSITVDEIIKAVEVCSTPIYSYIV